MSCDIQLSLHIEQYDHAILILDLNSNVCSLSHFRQSVSYTILKM